jgi:hypothetical protein
MVSKTRSRASKRAWKEREPRGKCFFCHDPVYVGGIQRDGHLWHRTCWNRHEVEELRRRTAKRGFYAKKKK